MSVHAFRWLWIASCISFAGDSLRVVTINLWIFDASDASSASRLAAVLAEGLPVLLFAGFSGVLADRFDKLRVVVSANWIRGGLSALLAVCAWMGIYQLSYPLLVASAVVAVFLTTSAFTVVPSMVPSDQLMSANAMLEIGARSAAVAGPAIGALVFALVGPAAGFLVDAGSFGIAALVVSRIRARGHGRDGDTGAAAKRQRLPAVDRVRPMREVRAALGHLRDGATYLRSDTGVLWMLVASYGLTVTSAANSFALIFFVLSDLEASPQAFGLLVSWGAVVSIAASSVLVWGSGAEASKSVFGTTLVLMVLSGLVIAASPTVWWAAIGVAVSAAANGPYNVAVSTLFQTLVDEEYLGRAEGIDSTVDATIAIATFAATAAVVAVSGPRTALVVAAMVGALLSSVGLLGLRRVRPRLATVTSGPGE